MHQLPTNWLPRPAGCSDCHRRGWGCAQRRCGNRGWRHQCRHQPDAWRGAGRLAGAWASPPGTPCAAQRNAPHCWQRPQPMLTGSVLPRLACPPLANCCSSCLAAFWCAPAGRWGSAGHCGRGQGNWLGSLAAGYVPWPGWMGLAIGCVAAGDGWHGTCAGVPKSHWNFRLWQPCSPAPLGFFCTCVPQALIAAGRFKHAQLKSDYEEGAGVRLPHAGREGAELGGAQAMEAKCHCTAQCGFHMHLIVPGLKLATRRLAVL